MARNNYRNNRNKNEPPSAPNARKRGTSRARRRSLKNPFTKPGSQQTFTPGSQDDQNQMWYYQDYLDGGGGGNYPQPPGQTYCILSCQTNMLWTCHNNNQPCGGNFQGCSGGSYNSATQCNNACGGQCGCSCYQDFAIGGQCDSTWGYTSNSSNCISSCPSMPPCN